MEMRRYHFRVGTPERANDAAFKAIDDCRRILFAAGYEDTEVIVSSRRRGPREAAELLLGAARLLRRIAPGSIVVVQYPVLAINGCWPLLAACLRRRGCVLVGLVHDLESLRRGGAPAEIARELRALRTYDALILHGAAMEAWARERGLTQPMTSIELFDYISDGAVAARAGAGRRNRTRVCFAGNLRKSEFIYALDRVPDVAFDLYGDGFEPDRMPSERVEWLGSFPPEELPQRIQADYGLVWDGGSIEQCADRHGDYLKYNAPHKVSFYLRCGLPVVVPASSSIAEFVRAHGVGIAVDSLLRLPQALAAVSESERDGMRRKAGQMAGLLAQGHFLRSALDRLALPA